MGREKKPIYQYSEDGKFLQEYESITQLREKYKITKGNMFGQGEYERNYRKLPDGTYISTERLGRDGVKKIVRIDSCEFCTTKYKTSKIVEVYNLLGEKLAEFNSLATLCKMTNKPQATLFHRGKNQSKTTADNLIYKFKKQIK